MKKLICSIVLGACAMAFADTLPVLSGVTMSQRADRKVNITYRLADAPAIVTVDIETNRGDSTFVSIGGAALRHLSGHVSQVIQPGADVTRLVMWDPSADWPSQTVDIASGDIRAVLTAYPTNQPPDYLVVDLARPTEPLRYYTSTNFLPYDIHDDYYLTNSLVMRKIPAKNIKWRIGAAATDTGYQKGELPRQVMLSEDFYIGVFEMTRGQAGVAGVSGKETSAGFTPWQSSKRPVFWQMYANLRGTSTTLSEVASSSAIGMLRTRYGLPFDIPTEAQWEFACRAGCKLDHYDGTANSATDNATLNALSRHRYNSGRGSNSWGTSPWTTGLYAAAKAESFDQFTARPGSYKPNAWGLYDMLGNVAEWCRDYAVARSTESEAVLVDPCESDSEASKASDKTRRIAKGGTYSDGSWSIRAPFRYYTREDTSGEQYNCDLYCLGYRLVLPISGQDVSGGSGAVVIQDLGAALNPTDPTNGGFWSIDWTDDESVRHKHAGVTVSRAAANCSETLEVSPLVTQDESETESLLFSPAGLRFFVR